MMKKTSPFVRMLKMSVTIQVTDSSLTTTSEMSLDIQETPIKINMEKMARNLDYMIYGLVVINGY